MLFFQNLRRFIGKVRSGIAHTYHPASPKMIVTERRAERERLSRRSAALISFLESADRQWLESVARLTEEEIRQQLRIRRPVHISKEGEPDISGMLHAFVATKSLIAAGAAVVEFDDQPPASQRSGDPSRTVVVPTHDFIGKITAGRLAADVCGARTILMASTFAKNARFLLSNTDSRDQEFVLGQRTPEGFFSFRGGLRAAVARGLAVAPYADMVCYESSDLDLSEAREFAENIRAIFRGKFLACDCSPVYKMNQLDNVAIERIQSDLGQMGYVLQFVTLGGIRSLHRSVS